jgi:hypothetical protein
MANQRTYANDGASFNRGEVVLKGAFSVNGTSDPVAFRGPLGLSTDLPNGVTSIVYSATGIYTMTFDENFFACVGQQCNLSLGTAADKTVQFNGFSNLGSATAALTCTFQLLSAGSAASIAAASGNEVWFEFTFKRSMAK